MTGQAVITGSGWKIGRPLPGRLEVAIRDAVLKALDTSKLSIEDIDTFITVGSDTLDGLMVAGRPEIAGAYSRKYLNVPSSAGHGLAAAVTQIESGESRNLVLVGWGAATKLSEHDGRSNQADPFFARPMGASPRVLAALQARELLGIDGLGETALQSYVQLMVSRAWQGDETTCSGAAPAWARSAFCDGVVAIVVQCGVDAKYAVTIRGFASVSRPYSPEDDRLDTAAWVSEALADFSNPVAVGSWELDVIEAAAPTPIAEARALGGVGPGFALDGSIFNQSGGGASAHFGAATGLRQIAEACRILIEKRATKTSASGLVLDLCGPLGQHATAILLQAGANK
jgi:hypothetical protein